MVAEMFVQRHEGTGRVSNHGSGGLHLPIVDVKQSQHQYSMKSGNLRSVSVWQFDQCN